LGSGISTLILVPGAVGGAGGAGVVDVVGGVVEGVVELVAVGYGEGGGAYGVVGFGGVVGMIGGAYTVVGAGPTGAGGVVVADTIGLTLVEDAGGVVANTCLFSIVILSPAGTALFITFILRVLYYFISVGDNLPSIVLSVLAESIKKSLPGDTEITPFLARLIAVYKS